MGFPSDALLCNSLQLSSGRTLLCASTHILRAPQNGGISLMSVYELTLGCSIEILRDIYIHMYI